MNIDIKQYKRLCPFVNDPQDNCYCMKLRSEYTEKIIYYCKENYKKCDIYKNINKIKKKCKNNLE
jgi:hypothetical protein